MRNVSYKKKIHRKSKHVLSAVAFLSPENCTVYTIMWKNMVLPDRPQMAIYDACALHAG